jgi:2,3-bisphosphoglycerate-independent phosphoglycerate mutase
MPPFAQRFGVQRGCMISSVDLLRGLAILLGWDIHDVEGMTSFHDTNYAGQGRHTADMLDRYDLVFSHIEAPDEASHQADHRTKIAAIEAIDRHIVGPVLGKLQTFDQWRILVMPDHATNVGTRKHGYAPPCFAMAGTGVPAAGELPYSERNAAAGGLMLDPGHELMELFLKRP